MFGLYKRFHTEVEGRGMGLFMVKTQVETLGGKISISSKVNVGTEFKNKSSFILTYNISSSFEPFEFISGFIQFSFNYPDIINPVSFVLSGFIISSFL